MKSFPCLNCGGHIGYESSDAGQVGACPHCGTPNIVPKDRRMIAAILTTLILCCGVFLFYIHHPTKQSITVSSVEESPFIVKTPATAPSAPLPKQAVLKETNPIIPAQMQLEPSMELKLARYNMGQENERLRLITQDYGIDPTDRLLRQLNLVKIDSASLSNQLLRLEMVQSNAPLAKAYIAGSLDYLSLAKINIQQALAQRSAEVDRDIKQLEIDGQKKFMREFYGH